MKLGYSTNSIGDIDPLDAVPVLRDLGYESLAITLDHHTIDPAAADVSARVERWRRGLAAVGMGCVIETGGRHLLDPAVKHEPTLVSPGVSDRARRIDFSRRAIDVAAALGAGCVSLWSGVGRDSAPLETHWHRLLEGLGRVIEHAAAAGVVVSLEPEPGMVVDTIARATALGESLGWPASLQLTVDIGHLECMGEWPYDDHIRRWPAGIANVHVDDMLACRHEHLPLGQGDVDLVRACAALVANGYRGALHVELPRQTHCWQATARSSALILASVVGPETSA